MNELRFYRKERHRLRLPKPTHLSFLGLLNVQERARNVLDWWEDAEKHNQEMYSIIGDEINKDLHTLNEANNFAWENGHIRMFDYGSSKCREVLEEYGEQIYENYKRDQ